MHNKSKMKNANHQSTREIEEIYDLPAQRHVGRNGTWVSRHFALKREIFETTKRITPKA